MASIAERIYEHSPTWLQHAAVSAFGYRWKRRRFGGSFDENVRKFQERNHFTSEQWTQWQTQKLRELLRTALTRVPFYRETWRNVLSLKDIETFTLQDLPHLPLLEKETVRATPDAFLIDGVAPKDAVVCATSGSSGTPVRTYWTDSDFQRSLALREVRACQVAGVSYSRPRATFSGRLVVPGWQTKGPFHRFNVFERQVYFSAFHLSPDTAAEYVAALAHHRIEWGTGYTHAWELLARLMLEQNVKPPQSLRAIITTSERLTSEGRELIERAFRCRVFQEYGQVEEAVWACEGVDSKLRVSPDAGILEVVRPDGSACDPLEPGDVVATGLIRLAQPLIRYRLGDVVTLESSAETSGQTMPVIREIVGRLEDVVVGPDGRRTARFHGIFTELVGCREAQVVQNAKDHLTINLVHSPEWTPATDAEIRRRIEARLGSAFRVDVVSVPSIPRTQGGKFRAVVNLMNGVR